MSSIVRDDTWRTGLAGYAKAAAHMIPTSTRSRSRDCHEAARMDVEGVGLCTECRVFSYLLFRVIEALPMTRMQRPRVLPPKML
jgi:hypothetical protein